MWYWKILKGYFWSHCYLLAILFGEGSSKSFELKIFLWIFSFLMHISLQNAYTWLNMSGCTCFMSYQYFQSWELVLLNVANVVNPLLKIGEVNIFLLCLYTSLSTLHYTKVNPTKTQFNLIKCSERHIYIYIYIYILRSSSQLFLFYTNR